MFVTDTVTEKSQKMSDKLSIGNEMRQFDLKNRDFCDSLDDQEIKKFSPFLMIRWGATVRGPADLQAYYLMSVNENLNKHFFDISATQHKKLQWLLATTVSPGMGVQRHDWLAAKKKETGNNKVEKFLFQIFPNRKPDEIQLMAQINTKDELKQMARELGWDDKKIKEYL
jgi:hypothetical protein